MGCFEPPINVIPVPNDTSPENSQWLREVFITSSPGVDDVGKGEAHSLGYLMCADEVGWVDFLCHQIIMSASLTMTIINRYSDYVRNQDRTEKYINQER